jgi:hypothetical protein
MIVSFAELGYADDGGAGVATWTGDVAGAEPPPPPPHPASASAAATIMILRTCAWLLAIAVFTGVCSGC